MELSNDSKMSDEFLLEASPEIGILADSYGITERQAVLFSICMDNGPRRIDFGDIALDISNIRALSYTSDIDAFVHRRLIRYRDVKDEDSFDVLQPVIKALKRNEAYALPVRKGLDCTELFEYLNMLYDDLDNDAVSPTDMLEEMEQLFEDNPQIGFVQQLKELYLHDDDDLLLLVLLCHLLINKDDNDVRFSQMECVFSEKSAYNKAKGKLRCGEHRLMEENLIGHRSEDGIADTSRYRLTAHAKRTLLAEMKLNGAEEKISDVLQHDKLTAKAMYYPEAIEHQVSELTSFFVPEQYTQIRERMQQRGFRHGFACLFYGGPGTGKAPAKVLLRYSEVQVAEHTLCTAYLLVAAHGDNHEYTVEIGCPVLCDGLITEAYRQCCRCASVTLLMHIGCAADGRQ